MSQLSILFLSSWYPNDVLNQNGNFVQQHARAVSLFCNVAVLNVQSKQQNDKIKVCKIYNGNVYEVIVYYKKINSTSVLSSFSKKKRQHKAFLEGYSQILNEFKKIDLVHLNVVLPAGFFALYLNRKFNIPFIVTEHSTIYLNSNPISHSLIERYSVKKITRKADFICPVSIDLKNALIKYGISGNFIVIPNVVNKKVFHFVNKKEGGRIKLLHVSTLNEEHKNIKGILNVIMELSKIRKDFVFQIIGDGDIESVINYAKSIKLDKYFYDFKSQKPSEQIAKAMQSSHLFIMFSNYENSPCVISESLVCGVPVLSSNVGGIDEMISKENGILVAARNEKELLFSLNKMLNNFSPYKGIDISEKAISIYSYESVGKQFLDIYQKALEF